jgi:hypothetical protein
MAWDFAPTTTLIALSAAFPEIRQKEKMTIARLGKAKYQEGVSDPPKLVPAFSWP